MRFSFLLLIAALFVAQLGLPAWSMAAAPAGEAVAPSAHAAQPKLAECGTASGAECDAADICEICVFCHACHPAAMPVAGAGGDLRSAANRPLHHPAVQYLSADSAPHLKPPIL